MFKFTKSFAAVALAVASIAASAQITGNNSSDLFNQDSSAAAGTLNVPGTSGMGVASSSSALSRKMVITNGQVSELGAAAIRNGTSANPPGTQARGINAERDLQSRERDIEKEPSEFQKFVADNTGKMLPVFGSEFFANTPTTFAPVSNAPVPSDYPLGPGDQLMIRGWGTIDIDYRATIDRNGTISIPTIGSVVLAGVKAGDAENAIRAAVGRLYKGVTVNVTFGQLRAITVYVVGQANRPGTYTVSSLSTLVTALFASGGPNANGSMRHVQVKRGGKAVAELDLYAFIAKGDKSADVKLQDGDTIFIPQAGGFVALTGKVNSPAVYELKSGSDTVESLLDVAGGLPVVADPRRAFLERIDPATNHPRSVEQFALEGQGLKRILKNGDVLNVTSITPDFSNAVVLRGNVDQPVRAPYKSGMRVSDLIPSREYLISRSSTARQNSVLADDEADLRADESSKGLPGQPGRNTTKMLKKNTDAVKDASGKSESIAARIGNLIDQVNWDYAVVERINRADLSVKLIPFNLGNVFTNPNGPDNLQLQPGDTVTIFSQEDVAVPMDKRQIFVRVEGEVKVPGVYQMTAGDTLQTLIAKAGGPTANAYLFGTGFYRDEVRKEQEANLQRAADRLETQIRSEQSTQMANLAAMSPTEAAASTAQFEAQRRLAEERITRFRKCRCRMAIVWSYRPSRHSCTCSVPSMSRHPRCGAPIAA
jgi:protein involved in polysaccharide export with SLBB domain